MLKYAEQFEHDYDNDNYSNYVEDVSVHIGNSYQNEFTMARFFRLTFAYRWSLRVVGTFAVVLKIRTSKWACMALPSRPSTQNCGTRCDEGFFNGTQFGRQHHFARFAQEADFDSRTRDPNVRRRGESKHYCWFLGIGLFTLSSAFSAC